VRACVRALVWPADCAGSDLEAGTGREGLGLSVFGGKSFCKRELAAGGRRIPQPPMR